MVVDGGVGVFEAVAGEDAGDAFVGVDGAVGQQLLEAGDGGGRLAGFAARSHSGR